MTIVDAARQHSETSRETASCDLNSFYRSPSRNPSSAAPKDCASRPRHIRRSLRRLWCHWSACRCSSRLQPWRNWPPRTPLPLPRPKRPSRFGTGLRQSARLPHDPPLGNCLEFRRLRQTRKAELPAALM